MIKIKLEQLTEMIEKKYISVKKHPNHNLWIYNYTNAAQYEKIWNETTMTCRGLILDENGDVVARPFKKFFNIEEHEQIPNSTDFKIYEKLDGSLGILYWIGDVPHIATRGSFTSDQAIKATQMLHAMPEMWKCFDRYHTYLFEIIYPENRIVVDYGKKEGLVFLTAIDPATGFDVDMTIPMESAKVYDGISDLSTLKGMALENSEGFVIRWADGFRVKVKFAEYVRLHRLVTGVTERNIWEIIRANGSINELIAHVPDEFYKWILQTVFNLTQKYKEIFKAANDAIFMNGYASMSRKEAAIDIMTNHKDVSAVIFKMLDNKPVESIIWDMIYPAASKPFNVRSEDVT